ncbi:hypothetical protein PHLGIDRAFT_508697 [Phlebiopsis gigantea 11061_1 CR5-6]|uniref:Uncharacterized protein n=1 Tax=Phlebiopsis gigantea (strain 11061_1 CR5-6) TaxID=745531 RepID=A0A0C3NT18_PHLG1|nr:hypothetical protein PHLGIDRAFT_508697 [Phlebiopsis gigantea 11061_1 CR5-6]
MQSIRATLDYDLNTSSQFFSFGRRESSLQNQLDNFPFTYSPPPTLETSSSVLANFPQHSSSAQVPSAIQVASEFSTSSWSPRLSSSEDTIRPLSLLAQDITLPSHSPSAARQRCSVPNCIRFCLSKKCSLRQCAKHCQQQTTPCSYKAHNRPQGNTTASAFAGIPGPAKPPPIHPTSSPHIRVAAIPQAPQPHSELPLSLPTSQQSLPSSSRLSTPYSPTPSHIPEPPLVATPKTWAKDFHSAWRSDWMDQQQARELKVEAERLRKANERMMDSSIHIWWWNKFCPQGISTWPTFNLAQNNTLLRKMELTATSEVEVYSLAERNWCTEDVNLAIKVSKNQRLLIRRCGVKLCPSLDERIQDAVQHTHGPRLVMTGFASSPAPSSPMPSSPAGSVMTLSPICTPAKRRIADLLSFEAESSDTGTPLAKTPRRKMPRLDSPSLFSPVSSTSALSPTPTLLALPQLPMDPPFSSSPASSNFDPLDDDQNAQSSLSILPIAESEASGTSSASKPPAAFTDIYNSRWDLGQVYVPSDSGPWLGGMYARDVAKGFALMTKLQEMQGKELSQEDRFHVVFSGAKYVHATFGRHWRVWRDSTAEQKEIARSLPRTREGL